MRAGSTGVVLSVICAWILWEINSVGNVPEDYTARGEADSFDNCTQLMHQEAKKRGAFSKATLTDAEIYTGTEGVVITTHKPGKDTLTIIYKYKCTPAQIDPRP